MSGISTHVLDTSRGRPASGIRVTLATLLESDVSNGVTDADGRCPNLLGGRPLQAVTYRLTFHTAAYFEAQGIPFLYPEVVILFAVRDPESHYHIPLLLGPHTYTTYRGS